MANGFTNDKFRGHLVGDKRPDVFGRQLALETMFFCGRLVADRRPDVFELQNALHMMIRGDAWSSTGGQTPSNGKWLYKFNFEGRLVGDRRPDAFEWQMA